MSSSPRPPSPERDAALDAAWKAHSTELPPSRIDAAILAAAHREAGTRPHAVGDDEPAAEARAPSRAWWGIAAAATIGTIAFGILQMSPPLTSDPSTNVATDLPRGGAEHAPPVAALRDAPATFAEALPRPSAESKPKPDAHVARETERRSAPALRADPAPTAAPSTNARKPSEPRQRRADAPEREASVEPSASPLAKVPAAASPAATRALAAEPPRPFPGGTEPSRLAGTSTPPAEPAKAEAAGSPVDTPRRESRERIAAPALPQPAVQAARPAPADNDAQRAASAPTAKLPAHTPTARIARIRALYVERRFADAARELNAFRDAFPDADTQLPSDLSAWAATVKRE